jgi:alpha-N-arabinofuranosidase
MSEAAFITGLERNSDVVKMSSYAPLFGHVEAWQWTPNMIWFDNLRSYGTPNYYVQKMFSVNRGTRNLPLMLDGSAKNGQQELYSSASLDEGTGEVIVKVVNTSSSTRDVSITLTGAKGARAGRAFVLRSEDPKAENSLNHPTKVSPVEQPLPASTGELSYKFLPHSFTVLRIPTR